MPELPEDPNFIARADIVEHDHPIAGRCTLLGIADQDDAPHAPMGPAPSTGDHSDEILSTVLGYDAARIAQLRAVRHRRVTKMRSHQIHADQAAIRSAVVVSVARSAIVLSSTAST